MSYIKDTIAAVATPMGAGAVGIVRISGPESLKIANNLFQPRGKVIRPYRLNHGWIVNKRGRVLDQVLTSYMPGPHSYTGEDVVEINCHGNPAIIEAVLGAVMSLGARHAEPGEFTKRAFLNGKIDLTQAEAVLEMINAPTETGVFLARSKLQGHLAEKIQELRNSLQELKRQLCLAVDFPEEEIECLSREELTAMVDKCRKEIAVLVNGFEQNRIWTDGLLAVLTGIVNAGKSSLMNAVIGRERAIVTETAGTTRDYLEEAVNLKGLPVRLVDTAGLRDSADQAEIKGIERGREIIDCADVLVLVIDAALGPSDHDREVLNSVQPEKLIIALNKWDLVSSAPDWAADLEQEYPNVLRISAKTRAGLSELTDRIRRMGLSGSKAETEGTLVPNLRQKTCLEKAFAELSEMVREAGDVPCDLLAARLDYACSELDLVTGRITPDQVLDSIFDNFCIGK